MMPVNRSLLDPAALGDLVADAYGLDVTDCRLIRSLANDVYRITTATGDRALKVYHRQYWSHDEIAWELDLVRHLRDHDVPVPPVLPTRDGRFMGTVAAPEGARAFAVTEYIAGHKPVPPVDDDLYRRFGRLIGRFHRVGDWLATDRPRRPYDIGWTLDEPLAAVLPALADRGTDAELVTELASAARDRIAALAATAPGLDWGVCHGDVTLDNLHVTDAGLVLHDFDSASFGWRALDLTGAAATPHWEAFLGGYRNEHPIGGADLAALPWFGVVARVGNLRFHLVDKPAWVGTESIGDGWVDGELDALRETADRLL